MKQERHGSATAFLAGVLATVGLHGGVFGVVWLTRNLASASPQLDVGQFVDAQLVKFGKPRDLSFLPHKQGRQKAPPEAIKVAKDLSQLPRLEEKKERPDEVDPLKKTRAELFKNMLDDREGFQEHDEGSLTGSRAGTATEAKGDPYILSLIDQIGSAWTVPTTIKESELHRLSADVCLKIAESGVLVRYEFVRRSGNSQFDSSLEATLATIKALPPPPERFRGKRLCPTFEKTP